MKVVSCKPLSKLFYVYLPLEKLINKEYFPIKEKFGLVSKKMFFFYFEWNTLSRSCKKKKQTMLFVDYNKFDP